MQTNRTLVVTRSFMLCVFNLALFGLFINLNPAFSQEVKQDGAVTTTAPLATSAPAAVQTPTSSVALPKGAIPPPPAESGMDEWRSELNVLDMKIILDVKDKVARHDTTLDKETWSGWLAARLANMKVVPMVYAYREHKSWQRIVTAYGVFGSGVIDDPLKDKAKANYWAKAEHIKADKSDEQNKLKGEFLDQLFKDIPFPLFACIPQGELLKDEKKQDELLELVEDVFALPYQFLPKSHREGYLDMLTRMKEVVSTPGWYEKEFQYYMVCKELDHLGLFTRKGVDGQDDPFRKAIAFTFRRVLDKTVTPERAVVVISRIHADLLSWNKSSYGESVHNPSPPPEKKLQPTEEDVYTKLQERLKGIEKK